MSGSEVGLCYPEMTKRAVDTHSGAPTHRAGAAVMFPEHILKTWPVEGERRAEYGTNRPGQRGRTEAMQPHKGWQKQECVEDSIRTARSNSGSSGALGGGNTPQYHSARNTTAVRAGTELGSKREQWIRALQKLGFCRISCVKGLDVGKGDMGITLKHMLQERIREAVPVVKMGSGHRMIPAATRRGQSRGKTVKDSETKLNDPRHALARRLGERGLDLVPVTQDRNSQFRAVAQQVFGDQSVHKTLRALACELIRTHSEYFETHIKELYPRSSLSQYLASMQGDAAGDVLTLQALAGLLRVEFQTVVGDDKYDTNLPMEAALSQDDDDDVVFIQGIQ